MRFPWVVVLSLVSACKPSGDSCEEAEACDTEQNADTDTGAPDTDTDMDTDTDADTDTDTDADTDADTDTDTDTDTDADTDTDVPLPVLCDTGVVPDEPCLVAADGSGTFSTIQGAVDAAAEGDIITVCPGVYGPVVIDTVGVTLEGYSAESTCIIGTTSAAAITVNGSAVAASPPRFEVNISGFTVSGTATSGTASDPAAIACAWSGGTFRDLRVAGVGAGPLAAVATDMCELTWEGVTVEDNAAKFALYNIDGAHTFRHSVFRSNDGTAIVAFETASLEASNCIFIGNGTGLSTSNTSGSIANNVFYANTEGLGVTDGPEGPMAIRNNVAAWNGWGYTGDRWDTDYNVAWENGWDHWPEDVFGPNDTSTDPLFEDAASGDFRLQETSPLIDAGDPDLIYNDVDGSSNDVGAFGGPYGDWSP